MSYLARTTTIFRITTVPRVQFAPRAFSTSLIARKTPVETVKDGVKTVDRAVSDKIVEGIEVGEKATAKVKEAAGMSSGEAKGKASEIMGEAKGKAAELRGQAKGKKEEIKGKL